MADVHRGRAAHEHVRAVDQKSGQAEHGGGQDPVARGRR